MSKAKEIFYYIVIFVLAAAFVIGFWAVGFFTAEKNDLWNIIFAVSLAAIGLLGILNIIGYVLLSRKFGKMKMRDLYDYFNEIRIKAQDDITSVRKKTLRVVVLSYIYLALIFALICFSAFACGKAGVESVVVFLLILLYLCGGVLDILFLPISDDLDELEVELTDSEYPIMRKTVERAAASAGYTGKIKLFMVGSGVSVNEHHGYVFITIGYKEAALFTSGELYAVMVHEFAHIVNDDVSRAKRLGRIETRWEGNSANTSVTLLTRLFLFSYPSSIIQFNIELYNTFAAIIKERDADGLVKSVDGDGSFADAIAKIEMMAKYGKMPVPEIEYYFFEPEAPSRDYATLDYNTYLKYYKIHGDLWRDELKKELPPRVHSHPTARMRIQGFGLDVQDCNYNAVDPDPMYVVEQQRVLERADAYIYERTKDSYAEQRQQVYLDRKQAIEQLDSAEASGGDLYGGAREKALWALLGIDDDRTLILADRMIAKGDRVPAANFAKAYVYKRRHDDRCVECFKAAAQEPNYAEDAYALIGEYALMTGNEKLIEQYRADIPDVMQSAQDKIKDNEFKSDTPTEPCDLDIEIIAQLAAKIDEGWNNALKKLYVCKYTAPDGTVHYPFAFDMTRAAALRSNNDFSIYYGIYDIIQSYIGDPSFIMCNPKAGLIRNVKRAKGVIVYDCIKKEQVQK